MGFRRNLTKVLDFSAYPDFEGFEVRLKAVSMSEALDAAELSEQWSDDLTPKQLRVVMSAMFKIMVEHIKSWNLEWDDDDRSANGNGIRPITVETLNSLDTDMQKALINGWLQSLIGVSEEEGKDSGSGETSPVALTLPMEPLSPSQHPSNERDSFSTFLNDLEATPTPA